MNKKLVLWLGLGVLVLIGGYLLFSGSKAIQPAATPTPAPVAGGSTAPSPTLTTGGTVLVNIKGFAFVSQSVKALPGTTIIWKNFDSVNHSVVGGNFQSGVLAPGQSFSHKFTQDGTYVYYDGLHRDTTGEIIIRNSNF